MKIELTQDMIAEVDDSDMEKLSKHSWFFSGNYAQASIGGKSVTMHRFLLDAKPWQPIDHVDGDKMNNRRANLRFCTPTQNNWNVGRTSKNTSGFKGVSWHKGVERWQAQIRILGKQTHLGYFDTPSEAHEVYRGAARNLHGEFARFE